MDQRIQLNETQTSQRKYLKPNIFEFVHLISKKKGFLIFSIRKPINEKVSSNTTSKEHFKNWEVSVPIRTSYEYPSYAGESLFPTFERSFTTHTRDVHKPISVKSKNDLRATIAKQDKDNLKPEGLFEKIN